MAKVILFDKPDGGIRVRIPSKRKVRVLMDDDLSEIEALDAIAAQNVSAGFMNARIVLDDSLPSSRVFRNAWVPDGAAGVSIDMPKARAIKTDIIRDERTARLIALDIEYIRADEVGNAAEKQRIAVLKQELRDLPATIQSELNAISTPEALEAWEPVWPV